MFKQKLEVIEFKMDGIPTTGNVATILSLEFVCSLIEDLGNFVKTFPSRTELAGFWVFGVLVDSVKHPVSNLEISSQMFLL